MSLRRFLNKLPIKQANRLELKESTCMVLTVKSLENAGVYPGILEGGVIVQTLVKGHYGYFLHGICHLTGCWKKVQIMWNV